MSYLTIIGVLLAVLGAYFYGFMDGMDFACRSPMKVEQLLREALGIARRVRSRSASAASTSHSQTQVSGFKSQVHIDCEAGFVDPVQADEFTFDVFRRWRDDADAPVRGRTMHTTDDEKRELNKLLEATAFKSFSAIKKAHQECTGIA